MAYMRALTRTNQKETFVPYTYYELYTVHCRYKAVYGTDKLQVNSGKAVELCGCLNAVSSYCSIRFRLVGFILHSNTYLKNWNIWEAAVNRRNSILKMKSFFFLLGVFLFIGRLNSKKLPLLYFPRISQVIVVFLVTKFPENILIAFFSFHCDE